MRYEYKQILYMLLVTIEQTQPAYSDTHAAGLKPPKSNACCLYDKALPNSS